MKKTKQEIEKISLGGGKLKKGENKRPLFSSFPYFPSFSRNLI